MPSIQDIADQINARLDSIATNTANTVSVSQDIRDELVSANATLASGFANLSQGLYAVLQVQLVALGLLDHHRQQNDTIICELVNANDLLCDIKRKFATQLVLSDAMLTSIRRVEGIAERSHCCEAGDYDRALALSKQILECCPPEQAALEPCPEECKSPTYRERKPSGQDWTPLGAPKQKDRVK